MTRAPKNAKLKISVQCCHIEDMTDFVKFKVNE